MSSNLFLLSTPFKEEEYENSLGGELVIESVDEEYMPDESFQTIRDEDYMSSMFSKEERRIRDTVNEALDKLEYEDSVIWHEYPDKVYLQAIMDILYDDMYGDNIESDCKNADSFEKIKKCEEMYCKRQLLEVIFIYEFFKRREKK